MKNDMIFFSTDGCGLTSTSANHVANLAKEMIRSLEASLNSMVFYSTQVALIGKESNEMLGNGATDSELNDVAGRLRTVAKAKSLIAWLREAIKAKERLQKETENLTIQKYAELTEIEIPELPEEIKAMDEKEYFASLSLAERTRYYETETLASVLGKAIHPDGGFARAREALNHRIQHPRDVKGAGRDTLIYSHTPTVAPDKVDEVYFQLQKQYREAQAKVNSIKHDCLKAVSSSEIAANTQNVENHKIYHHRMEEITSLMNKYKKQRVAEIADYRIVIPTSLLAIYNEVSHLGKH